MHRSPIASTAGERHRARDAERPSAHRRGYGARWRRARTAYLAEHPLCRPCRAAGRVTEATAVDHIAPHKGDMQLFWRRSNWQPICSLCHGRKTARELGWSGLGRS